MNDEFWAVWRKTGGGAPQKHHDTVIREDKMTKDELIVKQQLEIEELKERISIHNRAFDDIRQHLYHPGQWSTKCPDFPKVAMTGIVRARQALDDV